MGAILALPRGLLEFIFLTVGRYNINNVLFTPKVLEIYLLNMNFKLPCMSA